MDRKLLGEEPWLIVADPFELSDSTLVDRMQEIIKTGKVNALYLSELSQKYFNEIVEICPNEIPIITNYLKLRNHGETDSSFYLTFHSDTDSLEEELYVYYTLSQYYLNDGLVPTISDPNHTNEIKESQMIDKIVYLDIGTLMPGSGRAVVCPPFSSKKKECLDIAQDIIDNLPPDIPYTMSGGIRTYDSRNTISVEKLYDRFPNLSGIMVGGDISSRPVGEIPYIVDTYRSQLDDSYLKQQEP